MWGSFGESNYNALQTTLQRRFDNGLMVGVSYTFSKTLGTGANDYTGMRIDGKDRQYNYGILDRTSRTTSWPTSSTRRPSSPRAPWVRSRTAGRSRHLPLRIRLPLRDQLQVQGRDGKHVITGSEQGGRIVLVGDPGPGWSDDPYMQVNPAAFAPPQPGSIGIESSQFFVRAKPLQNLDLSLSKSFQLAGRAKFEVRLDAFNALNHVNIFAINNTIEFASLKTPTVTNAAYNPDGTVRDKVGFGAVNNVWPGRQLQLVTRLTF